MGIADMVIGLVALLVMLAFTLGVMFKDEDKREVKKNGKEDEEESKG